MTCDIYHFENYHQNKTSSKRHKVLANVGSSLLLQNQHPIWAYIKEAEQSITSIEKKSLRSIAKVSFKTDALFYGLQLCECIV